MISSVEMMGNAALWDFIQMGKYPVNYVFNGYGLDSTHSTAACGTDGRLNFIDFLYDPNP
ncbi:MAG: hypothetical protein WCV56_01980 [Candidatus Omnitrophota bacterium]